GRFWFVTSIDIWEMDPSGSNKTRLRTVMSPLSSDIKVANSRLSLHEGLSEKASAHVRTAHLSGEIGLSSNLVFTGLLERRPQSALGL
ncbi:mCG53516, partial [Mus musculus]